MGCGERVLSRDCKGFTEEQVLRAGVGPGGVVGGERDSGRGHPAKCPLPCETWPGV